MMAIERIFHRHSAWITLVVLMLLPARTEAQSAYANTTAISSVATALAVTSSRAGDVNADGTVNVADVMSMVGYIIGNKRDVTPAFITAADVNRDDVVNVTDVMIVVKIVMGMKWNDPDNPSLDIDDGEGRDPSTGN